MNELVVAALKSVPVSKDSPHVFVDPNSKEAIKSIERAWRKTLREGKIPNFRFHDLRHTFASRLVQLGVAIQVVKELLGHGDISTTMRYAHQAPADLFQAVEKLAFKAAADKLTQKAAEKAPEKPERKDEPKS
jgi:integrase